MECVVIECDCVVECVVICFVECVICLSIYMLSVYYICTLIYM